MGVIIRICPEYQELSSDSLQKLKTEATKKLSLLQREAEQNAKDIEARKGSLAKLRARRSELEVEVLSAKQETDEIEVALCEALKRESEEDRVKRIEIIKAAERKRDEGQVEVDQANDFWKSLENLRKAWETQQRAAMERVYSQEKLLEELMNKPLVGGVLPAPKKPDFLEAVAIGLRAPEDVIN